MSAIQHFILVFDRRRGELLQEISFGSQMAKAVARYEELEREYRADANMDIVLVGSDSIDTIKVTHANYFDGIAMDEFADVLSLNC